MTRFIPLYIALLTSQIEITYEERKQGKRYFFISFVVFFTWFKIFLVHCCLCFVLLPMSFGKKKIVSGTQREKGGRAGSCTSPPLLIVATFTTCRCVHFIVPCLRRYTNYKQSSSYSVFSNFDNEDSKQSIPLSLSLFDDLFLWLLVIHNPLTMILCDILSDGTARMFGCDGNGTQLRNNAITFMLMILLLVWQPCCSIIIFYSGWYGMHMAYMYLFYEYFNIRLYIDHNENYG